MDDAVTIINDRINSTGVAEPEIRKQGSDQIVIELPGVDDQQRAADLIGQTAKLELFDLQGDLVPGASLDTQGEPDRAGLDLRPALDPADGGQGTASRRRTTWSRRPRRASETERKLVVGPKPTREAILNSAYVKKKRRQEGRAAEGNQDPRRPREDGGRHVRPDRAVLPGRRPGRARPDVLLPLPLRPAERGEPGPRDDRGRPGAQGNAAGLRLRPRPRERAGRDHAVHRRRSGQVRERHADARRARTGAGEQARPDRQGPRTTPRTSSSRSSSTARSSPRRPSTSTTTRAASRATTARSSPASRSRRRRTSPSSSARGRCRSSSSRSRRRTSRRRSGRTRSRRRSWRRSAA